MPSSLPPQTPGVYPGTAQASLLRYNEQVILWNAANAAGLSTIAVQLERIASRHYPWGAALQVKFSGAPGTFEIDLQGSETDEVNSYISLVTITAVNASNFGRCDMTPSMFPKFVNAFFKTLTNNVTATLILTH